MTNTTNTAPCHYCDETGGRDIPCGACNGRGVRPVALCEACGEYEATRDGLCSICDDDVMEFLGGGAEAFTGARYYVGDDEGELLARGVRC